LNQDRIADEVEADASRRGPLVEVDGHRFGDLLLQIPQIAPLSGDATTPNRVVSPSDEPARLVVPLDLQGDLFHVLGA
jgi:hypothetical protein